jgi:hypothetical protein
MFQTSPRNNAIMQPTSHLNASQNRLEQDVSASRMVSTGLCESSKNMHFNAQNAAMYTTDSSGTTTPVSTRSRMSHESNASSASTSASSRPSRSSLKPSLKASPAVIINFSRKSSPPIVRFANPEPLYRQRSTQVQPKCENYSLRNDAQNPLHRHQDRLSASFSGSALSRYSASPQIYTTLPPRGVPTPQSEHVRYGKTRAGQRFSAPVQRSRPDPRWSGLPRPTNFTSPSLALEHRVSSFHSVTSDLSVQSASTTLQALSTARPKGQYNPLEHYIPCLHTGCKSHYSRTRSGPAYHLPQAPYSLSKLHGYCAHHASEELKDTNALCKRQWETLRQNAGRKTLGQIATEFDDFLQIFRHNRRLEDETLKSRQKRVVLGIPAVKGELPDADTDWIWIYTPRLCTRASCPSAPYSPFSNPLFSFYHTSRSSNFALLPTLCPSCAKNEVECFEHLVMQKWGSRCGWDDREWNKWFEHAVAERGREKVFWENAQARDVKERRVKRVVLNQKGEKDGGEASTEKKGGEMDKNKKKSVFKRFFGPGKGNEE